MDDPLSDLLSRVRGRGAVLSRAAHGQRWGVRQLAPAASLTLVVPVRGTCWVTVDDEPDPGATPVDGAERKPLLIGTGEAALIAGPRPYTLGHAPDAEPELVVHGPGRYSDAAGHPSAGPEVTGVRTCGYPDHPGTSLIVTGSYPHAGAVDARLLQALPPLLRVRSDELPRPVVELLTEEVAVAAPGQQAVLDRLLDLTLVRVLRAVFARPDAPAPAGGRPAPTPWQGRRCAPCTRIRSGRGPWRFWRAPPGCPGRRSPAASATCWEAHRWPTSPSGG